jgi:hypothetical protein
MHYNIATQTTQQLIGFSSVINDLQISGNDVVWDQRTGSGASTSEIFHFNLVTGVATRLTTNSIPDYYPQVSSGNVVWQTFDTEATSEVFRRNLATGVNERLTNNSESDRTPEISGTNVVWQEGFAGSAVNNVYHRDLANGITTPLTHATTYPESHGVPKVSGSHVMWFGDVGSSALDREVYYYDLTSSTLARVTTNSFYEQYGDLSGKSIVFMRNRSLQTNKWDVVLATQIPEPSSAFLVTAGCMIALLSLRRCHASRDTHSSSVRERTGCSATRQAS